VTEELDCLEKALQKQLDNQDLKVISNFVYTQEDIVTIESAFKSVILGYSLNSYVTENRAYRNSIEFLSEKYPLCFALYLVWHGIVHYRDNNFWKIPLESLNLQDDANTQRLVGSRFLAILDRFGLERFKVCEATHIFVTPILSHGKVPNEYLEQFFEGFISELYSAIPDDIQVNQVVKSILGAIRKSYNDSLKRDEIEKRLRDLDTEEELLRFVKSHWEIIERMFIFSSERRYHKSFEEILNYGREYYESLVSFAENQENVKNLIKQELFLKDRFRSLYSNLITQVLGDIELYAEEEKCFSNVISSDPIHKTIIRRNSSLPEVKRPYIKKKRGEHDSRNVGHRERNLHKIFDILGEIKKISNSVNDVESRKRACQQKMEMLLSKLGKDSFIVTFLWRMLLQQITKIGHGDVEIGKQRLLEQFDLIDELAKHGLTAQEAVKICFSVLDRQISEDNLPDLLSEVENEKKDLLKELELVDNSEHGISSFENLNKSTKYFLLLGEESASDFVSECIRLLRNLKEGKSITLDIETKVSRRIVEQMQQWWEDKTENSHMKQSQDSLNKKHFSSSPVGIRKLITPKRYYMNPVKESKNSNTRNTRIPYPYLSWNADAGSVFITMPESRLVHKGQRTARLVVDTKEEKQTSMIDLRVRGGTIYTIEKTFALDRLASKITISLLFDDNAERVWDANLMSDAKPYLLFDNQGELIEDCSQDYDLYYLLLPSGLTLVDKQEKRHLPARCKYEDFSAFEISYDGRDQYFIRGDDIEINLFDKEPFQRSRIVGKTNPHIVVNGYPVFIGPETPRIELYTSDIDELENLSIEFQGKTIKKKIGYKDFRRLFCEEKQDDADPSILPLERLIDNNYGDFTVTIRHKKGHLHREQFRYIPRIDLEFSEEFFVPTNRIAEGKIDTDLDSGFFIHWTDESLGNASGKSSLIFPTSMVYLDGQIRSMNGTSIDFAIEIPAIRWRKKSESEWRITIEEIWHEELGEIEILLPKILENNIEVSLKDTEQSQKLHFGNDRIVTVNLLEFSDTVRSEDKRDNLMIVLKGVNRTNGQQINIPLVYIIRKWKILDFKYEIKPLKGKQKSLIINWKELGHPKNRVVTIWKKYGQSVQLLKRQSLQDCEESVSILLDSDAFSKKLIAAFLTDDGFLDVDYTYDDLENDLKFEIDFYNTGFVLEKMQTRGLLITSFSGPNHRSDITVHKSSSDEKMSIRDIEDHEVGGESEILFSGHIKRDFRGKRFDFGLCYFTVDMDSKKITMLVDKPGGDGAMYCPLCRRVFWDDIDEEHRKHHIMVDEASFELGDGELV
jgi:hypothetical protein